MCKRLFFHPLGINHSRFSEVFENFDYMIINSKEYVNSKYEFFLVILYKYPFDIYHMNCTDNP